MIRKSIVTLSLVAVGAIGTAGAQSLLGPKGSFSTAFYRLEYDPGRSCYKPTRPFSDGDFEHQIFVGQAKAYVSCMESNARSDADYAVQVVNEGYEKAVEAYLAELKRRY